MFLCFSWRFCGPIVDWTDGVHLFNLGPLWPPFLDTAEGGMFLSLSLSIYWHAIE